MLPVIGNPGEHRWRVWAGAIDSVAEKNLGKLEYGI